jgi:hypothetical protein
VTYLYPRLLAARADELFNDYQGLSDLTVLGERARAHDEASVFVATGGDRAPAEMLVEIRQRVLGFAVAGGFPLLPNRSAAAEFDLQAARYLHSSMGVAPAEASARDVWAFVALVLLPDVAYWRFYDPDKGMDGDRVLATDITRHVFGRLWWRAQLVHDRELEEPYAALSILGESDMDQVHARRIGLGSSPRVVRAILLVWDGVHRSGALAGISAREAFRDYLKMLLRLVPFISFDALDDDLLHAEIRNAAVQVVDGHRWAQAAGANLDHVS